VFSLRTYIFACLTPVAIILAMVLGGMAMANRMVTLQEIETMKRLAAYVALLAVPTMIAGIYGMNFRSMPELSWRYGYESVLLVMAALGGYLFYRLRKARWL
jgi:magnesium transporter